MKRVEVPSYPVSIFVAGADVRPTCQAHCDEAGLCVTVTPARYVYTDGAEDGWIIGLINYGRFPSEPEEIFAKAEALALRLIDCDGIESATIQAPNKTVWLSDREEGRDSDGTRSAETACPAPVPQDCQARCRRQTPHRSYYRPLRGNPLACQIPQP